MTFGKSFLFAIMASLASGAAFAVGSALFIISSPSDVLPAVVGLPIVGIVGALFAFGPVFVSSLALHAARFWPTRAFFGLSVCLGVLSAAATAWLILRRGLNFEMLVPLTAAVSAFVWTSFKFIRS